MRRRSRRRAAATGNSGSVLRFFIARMLSCCRPHKIKFTGINNSIGEKAEREDGFFGFVRRKGESEKRKRKKISKFLVWPSKFESGNGSVKSKRRIGLIGESLFFLVGSSSRSLSRLLLSLSSAVHDTVRVYEFFFFLIFD